VTHLLNAISNIGTNMLKNLKKIKIEKGMSDFQLAKDLQFEKLDLLADFASLPSLFPEEFKVEKVPLENTTSTEYASS
jgi:hypothetical protein